MELTQEQIQILRDYKYNPDDDNIRIKDICKKELIRDPLILYLLNDKELEESNADPTEYIGRSILNNYLVHPAMHDVRNFICLGCESTHLIEGNEEMKMQRVIFYVICDEKTNIEKYSGVGRHDLICARIKHLFNWTNKFGPLCWTVDERESMTDTDYATRTIIFQLETDNNLSKTINGKTIMNFRGFNAKKP